MRRVDTVVVDPNPQRRKRPLSEAAASTSEDDESPESATSDSWPCEMSSSCAGSLAARRSCADADERRKRPLSEAAASASDAGAPRFDDEAATWMPWWAAERKAMTVRMWSGIARTCETLSKPRGDEQIARSPGDVAPTEDETEERRERDEGQEGAGGRRGGDSEKFRDAAACVRVS